MIYPETFKEKIIRRMPQMQSDLGGRGRKHSPEERKMILDLIDEAVTSGARLEEAAIAIDLSSRTVIRWKNSKNLEDRRKGP